MVHLRQHRWHQVLVGLLVLVACMAAAVPAWADYSIDQVDIDATVASNGTVMISEDRTFSFDGSYHGVYWDLPEGTYEGADLTPQIVSVGIVEDGSYRIFPLGQSGADSSFETSDHGSYLEVKIYSAHEDEDATFRIIYAYPNLAQRYQDVGELYWKFVSDGWDVASDNVTCTIHLPVPSGESVVAGENVHAWGHGPLDAEVSFSGNDIVYTVPGVGTDEFAEARIVFPESWLSDEMQRSATVLDSVLSEEQQWAEEANARRERARLISRIALVGGLALDVLFIVLAVNAWRKERAKYQVQFDDEYFRDVPTDDHPATLAALLHDGKPDSNAMPAAIMRLTDLGYATLGADKVERGGLFKKKEEDSYYLDLVKMPTYKKPADLIDKATATFLFEQVPDFPGEDTAPGGQQRVYFSSIEKAAKKDPEAYGKNIEKWQDKITSQCYKRKYLMPDNPARKVPHVCLALSIVLAVVYLYLVAEDYVTGETALAVMAACAVAAIVCAIVPKRMTNLTPKGQEIVAKLEALKRWLLDFTRLKEAVPQDVVLWNRLLVMAVALGISKEVIRQLKEAQPALYDQLAADPYSPYYWYGFWGPDLGRTPMDALGKSVESAHSVGEAALAKSSNSSFSGGGGGFSGGGGGGFGGGGGGGAF